jgi:hypothetical protein
MSFVILDGQSWFSKTISHTIEDFVLCYVLYPSRRSSSTFHLRISRPLVSSTLVIAMCSSSDACIRKVISYFRGAACFNGLYHSPYLRCGTWE